MVFLLILAIALGGLMALALLVVGLLEAPWPVLLVGLLAALYGLQRLLVESDKSTAFTDFPVVTPGWQSEPVEHGVSRLFLAKTDVAVAPTAESAASDDSDELVYRGIHYHPAASGHTPVPQLGKDVMVEGVYRGHHWQHKLATQQDAAPSADTTDALVYRGHRVLPHQPGRTQGETFHS
jgi:hypothetical protein